MSVGVQIGPECVPSCGSGRVTGCGAKASGAPGSGSSVNGSPGSPIPASGDSEESFQSSWNQFLEALGLKSSEEPGDGNEAGPVAAPGPLKAAPGQALNFSLPAPESKLKAGNMIMAPREAPEIRTDSSVKKTAGCGSKVPVQAHESRKRYGLTTTSAGAVEPASGSGYQLISVSTPDISASRDALPPTVTSARGKTFALEPNAERRGGLSTSAVDAEATAKGSIPDSASHGTGNISANGAPDASGEGSLNAKGSAPSSGEKQNPDSTEAASNPGSQVPSQDLTNPMQAGGPAHAATGAAIANSAEATSTASQLTAAKPAQPVAPRSALRSMRTIEPLRAERMAHTKEGGEYAGERGLSSIAAQDAGSPLLVRDPAGIAGASATQRGSVDAVHPAGNQASGLTGEETFTRLDADNASHSIHWVHAGAHRAEAGYLDPALGWIAVRAETSGGGVHASVLPGSSEAAQVLGTHLSGLNAFLAQQHGPHATATMASPQDGSYGGGAEQGNSTGGGNGRDDGPGKNMTQAGGVNDVSARNAATAGRVVDTSVVSDGSAIRRAGTYVSVMA